MGGERKGKPYIVGLRIRGELGLLRSDRCDDESGLLG